MPGWGPWTGVRVAAAAVSGLVLYLSFAPRPSWWLAPLAFTGLGLVLHARRFWAGCGYGFAFGCGLFLPLLAWLDEFLGAQFGPWPWLAVSAVLALYLALAGGVATLVQRLPGGPIWMALVVIATETPRSWFPLGGFPWGRVAFTQPQGVFLPLAAVGGAPLVGFAVALTGFALAACGMAVARRRWRALACPATAVVLPLLAGLAAWPVVTTDAQTGSRTVAVVQGNAPDIGLALQDERSTLTRDHIAQTEGLLTAVRAGRLPRPDLVVWPESAASLPVDRQRIDSLVRRLGVPAVIGALERLPDGRTQNVAVVWTPGAGPSQRYAKQQLVPFGEYTPAPALARLVTPFADSTAQITPGTGNVTTLPAAGTTLGPLICYEVAYDYLGRDAVAAGAQLLVVPTNNAWYGRSEMSYQQLAMARLRAVEHGRAVVVAATTGVSAIIRTDGSISQASSLFTPSLLVDRVVLRDRLTLSDRLGPVPEYLIVATAAGAALAGAARARWRSIRPGR